MVKYSHLFDVLVGRPMKSGCYLRAKQDMYVCGPPFM